MAANILSDAVSFEQPLSMLSVTTIGTLVLSAVLLILYNKTPSFRSKTDIRELGGLSILTAWPFFEKRYEFLVNNFKRTGEKLFQFRVLQHTIVATSGEEGRRVFFNDKRLDFSEGYRILLGGIPRLSDIKQTSDADDPNARPFQKHFATVFTRERTTNMLPILLAGMQRQSLGWGKSGRMNPFKDVYDIVFQMTIRMASCSELADDFKTTARLADHYWTLEQSATPTALLLPWFPGKAKRDKERATRQLYTLLLDYINIRRKATVPSADTMDILLQNGVDDGSIVQFVMSAVFAGVVNTGMMSCWLLLYLEQNPEWKTKLIAEVHALLNKYTSANGGLLLHERLASIPLEGFEQDMPVCDLVIRETIRIILGNGTMLRRNVTEDLKIGGQVVPAGAFMTYTLADVHFDESIYPDPMKWDPSRYEAGREEDKKTSFGFLGWGVGRHPCTGMKIAKLEIKMIIAMFLAGFKYKLVDDSGNFPNPFPARDPNDLQKARPLGKPCYLDFERIMD